MTNCDTTRRTGRLPVIASVDGLLLAAVLGLTAIGAVMVYSASAVTAQARNHDQFYFLARQLVAGGGGLAVMLVVLRLGKERMERLSYPLLGLTFLSLLLVLVPGIGHTAGGARRWIDLGVFYFQPSEAAKVALVLYLAHSLAKKRDKVRLFSIGFLPHLLVTLALAGLCLAERDLGSAVVLVLVLFTLLFAAGARVSTLIAAALCAIPIGWKLLSGTPYRARRWEAFLDPFGHRQGAGFQMVESLLGIGNGGWLGQGLGEGKGKLFYLPAAHNDFIAAVIAEEAGLLGIMVLLLLYAVVVWRGLRAAFNASDAFGCYAALGVTALIGGQALLNLSVAFGLVPTKGLTLPFVSYGGSSLITLLAAAGLLLLVSSGQGGFLRPSAPTRAAAPSTAGGAP